MLFVGVVLVVFTVGYRLAGWSWSDALYMVVITAFSVGFGEAPASFLSLARSCSG